MSPDCNGAAAAPCTLLNSYRPILIGLLKQQQPGDQVMVYKLDRIARSLKDLLSIQERIIEAGVDFKSLTETLDTSTPAE